VFPYNPSTWEAEAGRSRVLGKPALQNKTLSQQSKTNKQNPVNQQHKEFKFILECI
jgi:hypothetical protein